MITYFLYLPSFLFTSHLIRSKLYPSCQVVSVFPDILRPLSGLEETVLSLLTASPWLLAVS